MNPLRQMTPTHSILLLAICVAIACTPDTGTKFTVAHKGALKHIMHKGDLSAQADLADLQEQDHLYALGAVEQLNGEILILDGTPFIASVRGQGLNISHSFAHKATLLVYTSVDRWISLSIPEHVTTYEALETHIEQVAQERGINPNEPFPFQLMGRISSCDWHVINWKAGDTEHSHAKHKQSGLNGTLHDQDVHILGFYSQQHHGIFTHHSTNMHLHVKTADNQLAGHVDGLVLDQGMSLKLPAVN